VTGPPNDPEGHVDKDREPNDRILRVNEAAIGDVRRQVASAVSEIDRALTRLREVLDTRLPELRRPDSPDFEEGGNS
jgi:hypothetical protein